MFPFEPFFGEEGRDVGGLYNLMEGLQLCLQVTTLQTQHPIGQGIPLCLGDILSHNLHEVG